MPVYPGNDLAVLLYENRQGVFFNNETVTLAILSNAFQLRRDRGAAYPWGFSVEVAFSGAPGTFEFDVMGSDTDNAAYFVKLGTITAVNAGFVGRFDTVAFWPKYVALLPVALANAVTVKAQVTR